MKSVGLDGWPQVVMMTAEAPSLACPGPRRRYADGAVFEYDYSWLGVGSVTLYVNGTFRAATDINLPPLTDGEVDAITELLNNGTWNGQIPGRPIAPTASRPHTPASEEDPDDQRGGVWRVPVVAASVTCPSCQGQRMKRLESGLHYCPTCSWHGKVTK